MEDVCIKVDIPVELKDKFEAALAKVTEQFVRKVEFAMVDDILKDSELTEEQCFELADELKRDVAKKHGL